MTSVPTQGVHIPGDMSGSMVPRLQLKEIDSYTAKLPASTEHETETVPLDLDDIVGINGGLKENHVIVDSTPTFVSLEMEMGIQTPRGPPDKGKLYYLSACFLMFFAAFLPAQSLITTVFGTSGFWGLFTLYLCFSVSAFYATTVIKMLGVRNTLFIASCVNVAFIGTCIPAYVYRDSVGWLFFLACGIFGLIGAPLWVSQGIYLSRLTQHHPEVVGMFNGTFLGIFFAAGIFGNLLTTVIGYTFSTLPIVPIFICLFVLACIAAVLFKFLPDPPVPIVSDPPLRELFDNMWKMAQDKGIMLMSPYYFFLGLACTFAWGVVPKLLPDPRLIGPVACIYGVGTLCTSFISGRIFDLYGWKPLAAANLFLVFVGYAGVEIAYRNQISSIFFFTSVLFGSFEALGNTLALSVIMKTYTKNASTAFFFYRLWTGFGNAIGFLVGLVLQYNWEMIVLGAMCVITLVLLSFYLTFVQPSERVAAKAQFTDDGA